MYVHEHGTHQPTSLVSKVTSCDVILEMWYLLLPASVAVRDLNASDSPSDICFGILCGKSTGRRGSIGQGRSSRREPIGQGRSDRIDKREIGDEIG